MHKVQNSSNTFDLRVRSLLAITDVDNGEQWRRLVEPQHERLEFLRRAYVVVGQRFHETVLVAIYRQPKLTTTGCRRVRGIDRGKVVGKTLGEEHSGLTTTELALLDEVCREDVAITVNET